MSVFIRDSKSRPILDKILTQNFTPISNYISHLKPFGIRGYFSKSQKFYSSIDGMNNPIGCYAKGRKLGFVEINEITSHKDWINAWKVFIPRANNIGTELNDDNLNSFIGKPTEICTESYLIVSVELNLDENSSQNLKKYFETKFLRYMHSLLKSSQDSTSKTFDLVPLQDFTNNSDIDWSKSISDIDKELHNKYNLSKDEISYIEEKIKPMN